MRHRSVRFARTRVVGILQIPIAAVVILAGGPVTLPTEAVGAGRAVAAPVTSCPAPGGMRVPSVSVAGTGIIIQGHGWGHGLGMSQYGAQGAARLGCSHAQILAAYYAGTRLVGTSMTAPVALSLLTAAKRSTVYAESDAVTWVAAGRTVTQPARTTWTVTTAGGLTTVSSPTGTPLPRVRSGGSLEVRHVGAVVRLRSFTSTASNALTAVDLRLRQGTLGFAAAASTAAVSEVISGDVGGSAVDRYLRGLGEVPVTWPQEALRAQADAARTYLTHSYDSRSRRYAIGVTTAAQVYRGADQEDTDVRYGGRWRVAVSATHDEVIVDRSGTAIWAMYASSDGGRAESRAYVYGSQAGYSYLVGLDDSRWDLASDNPLRSWARAFAPADLAARLGFTSVSGVSIAGPGTPGRAAGLVVTGTRSGRAATARFTGDQLRAKLGLQSPVITVSWAPSGPTAPQLPTTGTAGVSTATRLSGVLASTACTSTACAGATARFSGTGSLIQIRETIQDRSCNHRRAYVRLRVRYTNGTTQLTPVRYAANRCRPPGTTYSGLAWRAPRPIAGFAVVVGEVGGRTATGSYRDNPNT
jgi:stage II sporulation protein D